MDKLETALHQVGTMLDSPALGGGSNLGIARGSKILHWLADAVGADEAAVDQLVEDIAVIAANHGNPPKGLWEAMVQRAAEVVKVVKDGEKVVESVKVNRKKGKQAPAPAADPKKDTSGEQKLDPQP